MLLELAVADLGVISELSVVLGPGMTALTGETGAGKTLLVEAIELLVGGRADGILVRPGAEEARVEGCFLDGDDEVVLARVVPRNGRSRAYVDGRLATAAVLAERGATLVDLHGQHAHQSLLSPATQRAALDRVAGVDLGPLQAARARAAAITRSLAELGGDGRARARELDLLRFQVAELDAAAVQGPDEDDALEAEEDRLAGATAHRDAASAAHHAISGDGGAVDSLGAAVAAVAGRAPLAGLEARLRALAAEAADAAAEARELAETLEDDPERLEEVRARRRLLGELRRKYGETLGDVLAYADEARARMAALASHDERAAGLEAELAAARADEAAAAEEVAARRRAGAAPLAAAVERHLAVLTMAGARVGIEVDGAGPADDVTFLLAANRGAPLLPLTKVASGGELARAMLALRLALGPGRQGAGEGPGTLVFDEVDAGIGGQAAVAVGRALAALGAERQVLVVTHLPQVAAFADAQVAVAKRDEGLVTVATARRVEGGDRVVELSRMLSGSPDSTAARGHAEELLAAAAAERRAVAAREAG